jgi:hypothetical protein
MFHFSRISIEQPTLSKMLRLMKNIKQFSSAVAEFLTAKKLHVLYHSLFSQHAFIALCRIVLCLNPLVSINVPVTDPNVLICCASLMCVATTDLYKTECKEEEYDI